MAQENHWLPGFNFNVEEWDAEGQTCETLAICRTLALARRVGGSDRGEARRPLHDPRRIGLTIAARVLRPKYGLEKEHLRLLLGIERLELRRRRRVVVAH
jgi:hypothetical protein